MDFRTPPWSTAPTIMMHFSRSPADAIARPTSSRPKLCRSSESRRIPTAPSRDARAELSSTSSPSRARITCTAQRSIICAIVLSARPILSWRSSRTTASSKLEAPSAVRSSATRFSSSPDLISTSSTCRTSSNSSTAVRKSCPRPQPDPLLPGTTRPPIGRWFLLRRQT